MKITIINSGHQDPYYNMGLDQALSETVQKTGETVLRIYGWAKKAVTVGFFQDVNSEVDMDKCEQSNISVIRRITGGGAVYHDDEIVYSFMTPIEGDLIRKPILESYEDICQGVIEAGKLLDLNIKFVPLNDLIINDQKVSGNAQTRRGGVILQHGTILLGVDVDRMFELLLVPDEKMKGKMIATIKERVTSIKAQLGYEIEFDQVADKLIAGFKLAFADHSFEMREVSENENMLALKYASEKYASLNWTFNRTV